MSRPFAPRSSKKPFERNYSRPRVEQLEDRAMPSTVPTISGFVYADANNDGIYQQGTESPLGNNTIKLVNHNTGQIVATTQTAADGSYSFTTDSTVIGPEQHTATQTVNLGPTLTNFIDPGTLNQFNSSLGTLDKVVITESGTIQSNIQAENTSPVADTIQGTVSGNFSLTAPGVSNDSLVITGQTNSSSAAANPTGDRSFTGPSSATWNNVSASSATPNTITITDPQALSEYTGNGTVAFNETGNATSNATDTTGNITTNIVSHGQATITVTYFYHSDGPLQSGTVYDVVQPVVPAGYIPGLNAKNGTVLTYNPTPPEEITDITVNDQIPLAPNNNFGELKQTSISGYVYYDANANGAFDASDSPLAGVTVVLSGTGGTQTTQTQADGSYSFTKLNPGTYTVTETQPSGYLLGTDTIGTINGAAGNGNVVTGPVNEQLANITLASGDMAQNYDFGQLKAASLSGNVYVDTKGLGAIAPGDPAIAGATVTLSGFDDQGPVSATAHTASDGSYSFNNLRPGTYAITETQPAGYNQGHNTIGTQGGSFGSTDVIADIALAAGVSGTGNNFGEIKQPTKTPDNPLPKDANLQGILPIVSKNQLLSDSSPDYLDPAVRGQLAFVVGVLSTATGKAPSTQASLQGFESLQSGMSNAAFVSEVWNSTAQRTTQVDNLYESILNRAPTAQELATATAQLKNGANVLTLMQGLYVSPEFQQLHPTSDQLAQALSQSILNVAPGTTSTQNLVQSLGTEPLNTVVHDLLISDASVANLIDNTYLQTLRRPASVAEIQTWTPQIESGSLTLDALAQRLLSSQEFYQLAFNKIH